MISENGITALLITRNHKKCLIFILITGMKTAGLTASLQLMLKMSDEGISLFTDTHFSDFDLPSLNLNLSSNEQDKTFWSIIP